MNSDNHDFYNHPPRTNGLLKLLAAIAVLSWVLAAWWAHSDAAANWEAMEIAKAQAVAAVFGWF